MIGVFIAFFIAFGFAVGYGVAKATSKPKDTKQTLRSEKVLNEIDDILFRYVNQLDIVGETMMWAIREEISHYKRGKR